MSQPLLITENLTKDYGQFRALDSLSLSIEPGEVFGLLGPNGSGKSTAIRIFLGFLRPTAGHAKVHGFDSWKQSLQVRKHIAYLPGELRLYERFTGIQLIRFLNDLRGKDISNDLNAMAKRFQIDVTRPLVQLSSGMKRKVALLAIFLAGTPLAILDEPTNTLDPTMREELLEQIKLAKGRGQTILFSSHVLQEVEAVCDRVGVLSKGKLVHLQPVRHDNTTQRLEVSFSTAPTNIPTSLFTNVEQPSTQRYIFTLEGAIQPVLGWLATQQVANLNVLPVGLSALYHKLTSGEAA